ncbi:MAG TPA: hypothetical protein VH912_08300 [Streptosporangiaceae bacterium]
MGSAKLYLDLVGGLGAGGEVPLLGDHPEELRQLAALHGFATMADASVEEGALTGSTATLDEIAGAYREGLAGTDPDPGRLVIGVGVESAAAACHAVLAGAHLKLAEGLDDLEDLLRGGPFESVTLVGAARHFGPCGIKALQMMITGRGVPWGVLTGQSSESISWSVLKRWVAAVPRDPGHLLLFTHDANPGRRALSGLVSALYGSEITADVLRGLTRVPRELVAITGHGDQADAYLHAGFLCPRTRPDYGRLMAETGGDRVMRCFAEHDCYRGVALGAVDGVPAETKILVPPGRVDATVLLLNTCASLLAAPGYRYRAESALLNSCLEGMVPAVVALETVRPADPGETMLFSGLVRTGSSLGEATLALNQAQVRYFSGLPAFVLFGDPDLRPDCSRAIDTPAQEVAAEIGDGTVVRLRPPDSAAHAVRTRLPAGTYDRLTAEAAADSPSRVFVLPGHDHDDLLVVADRPFNGGAPNIRFVGAEPDRNKYTPDRLRLLQRRLDELAMLSCPADEDMTARLRDRIARALRAVHTTSGGTAKSAREAAADAELRQELLLFQSRAAQGWTAAWSDALTGEVISLVEERVLYGPFVRSDLGCPACRAPLTRVVAEDLYVPGAARTLWHCPSCTVVADLPEGTPMIDVVAAPTVRRGGAYEVDVVLPADTEPLRVTVVAAAILGSRGGCRPAISPAASRGTTRLLMPVDAKTVPGSYSLRVVVMDDLETRFHLRPVSITIR